MFPKAAHPRHQPSEGPSAVFPPREVPGSQDPGVALHADFLVRCLRRPFASGVHRPWGRGRTRRAPCTLLARPLGRCSDQRRPGPCAEQRSTPRRVRADAHSARRSARTALRRGHRAAGGSDPAGHLVELSVHLKEGSPRSGLIDSRSPLPGVGCATIDFTAFRGAFGRPQPPPAPSESTGR